MIEEQSLQDSCGKDHGIARWGVKGIHDGDVRMVAPVCLVHPLPQPRVLVLPVPVGEANLRESNQFQSHFDKNYGIVVLPGFRKSRPR